jgi:hypothetical protein
MRTEFPIRTRMRRSSNEGHSSRGECAYREFKSSFGASSFVILKLKPNM